MFRKAVFFLLVAGLLLPAQILAAVSIVEDYEGERETHIYNKGVYYYLESGRLTNRFDGNRNVCLAVNYNHEIYFEGSCDAMVQGASAALEELFAGQIAMMSAEEKEMMQAWTGAMSGGGEKAEVQVKNIGSGRFLGYEIEKHVIQINGTPFTEVWISGAVQKMIEKEFDLSRYKAWSEKFKKVVIGLQQKLSGLGKSDASLEKAYNSIVSKGYPVKIQPDPAAGMMLMQNPFAAAGDALDERQVITVEQKSDFGSGRYGVPQGYARAASWKEFMSLDMQDQAEDDEYDYDDMDEF